MIVGDDGPVGVDDHPAAQALDRLAALARRREEVVERVRRAEAALDHLHGADVDDRRRDLLDHLHHRVAAACASVGRNEDCNTRKERGSWRREESTKKGPCETSSCAGRSVCAAPASRAGRRRGQKVAKTYLNALTGKGDEAGKDLLLGGVTMNAQLFTLENAELKARDR